MNIDEEACPTGLHLVSAAAFISGNESDKMSSVYLRLPVHEQSNN